MAFNFALAIAALDQFESYRAMPFNPLRGKYPELGFIFDELDELRELRELRDSSVSQSEYDEMQEELEQEMSNIVEDRDEAIRDKESAALEEAIEDAGIELDSPISGHGDSAMDDALQAIARAVTGKRKFFKVRAHG